MADPKIFIRRSATPSKVPTTDQLALGELAINTYDGKLYLEQDQGAVGVGTTIVAVNPWNVGVGSTAYNIYFTAGSVGIGTTNPTSKLTVTGDGTFSGVVTATTFSGALTGNVTGNATGLSGTPNITVGTIGATSLNASGVVTATSFSGSGSALTGIAVTQLSVNNTSVSVASTNGAINFVSNNVLVATMSSERIFSFVPIDLGNNKITNLATPTSLADAANKDYVDNNVAGEFPVGDYGDLSAGTNDAFGVNISGNETFDCLITPSGTLTLEDLGILT